MRNIRKLALLTSMIGVLVFTNIAFAFATADIKATVSGGSNFKKAWSKSITKSEKGGIKHILEYAYDTVLINEDCCYAYSNGSRHQAIIENDNGTHKGPKKWANEGWSDKEVRHKGTKVTYTLHFM